MKLERRFEIVFIIFAFIFSGWLFLKSFSYDSVNHQFHIARNEVGDFGLHLGLIRSFSWGNNFQVESPFFPGQPLPYHYYFDATAGLLERFGIRIDLAVNGLSSFAFVALLFLIYKLSQLIFGKSYLLGLTSVLLFVFPTNTSFIDFFKGRELSLSLIRQIWTIPDYLTRGPFDGKLPSIYFTQVVWLNQRHLVVGLAIGLSVIYYLLKKIISGKKISGTTLIILGVTLGFSTRVHSLIVVSTVLVAVALLLMFRRFRWVLPFVLPMAMMTALVYQGILFSGRSLITHDFFRLGFLTPEPFSLINLVQYWWANLWLETILIPVGFLLSNGKQKRIFLSFFLLFAVANIFQLSFRIEHNHSLVNYFLVIGGCYVSFVLVRVWDMGVLGKFLYGLLFILLTASGLMNLMAVKNDFQYPVLDAPANKFMQWVKDKTDRRAVFLSRQDLYDPVVLAGRRSYFGATYYLEVMGYDNSQRQALAREFFEVSSLSALDRMRQAGVQYLVLPLKPVNDFPYHVNRAFFRQNLGLVFSDSDVEVYKL